MKGNRGVPRCMRFPGLQGLGKVHLSYVAFHLFFAKRLFSRLESVTFQSQRGNLTVAAKTRPHQNEGKSCFEMVGHIHKECV